MFHIFPIVFKQHEEGNHVVFLPIYVFHGISHGTSLKQSFNKCSFTASLYE